MTTTPKLSKLIELADAMSSRLVEAITPDGVAAYTKARADFVKAVEDDALSSDESEFLARVEGLIIANWSGLALHKFQCIRQKLRRAA